MRNELKAIVVASILAVVLFAAPAFTQSNNSTQHRQQRMHGDMMGSGGMYGGMHDGMTGNWNQMGCGGMMGGSMMNQMTPGQQQTFMNQTTGLRKQMMELRFSYREAVRNPDTTPEDLAKIERQMLDVRTKMMDKAGNFQGQ